MKRFLIVSSLVVTLFAWGAWVYAQEGVDEVIDKLQDNYSKTADFSARFTLETMSKNIGAAVVNGRLRIKKPAMLLCEYTDPIKQQIISDGETLWYYQPDANKVDVYNSVEVIAKYPYFNFLLGQGEIEADFTASFSDPDMEKIKDFYPIILVPKAKDTSVEQIVILVSKSDYLIHQLNIYDLMGNVTRFAFKDISVNSGIKDSLFHFIAPSGVEVIRHENQRPPKPKINVEVETK